MSGSSKLSLSEKVLVVLAVIVFVGPIVYSYATQEERTCLSSMRARFARDVKVMGDYEWLEKTYQGCITKQPKERHNDKTHSPKELHPPVR